MKRTVVATLMAGLCLSAVAKTESEERLAAAKALFEAYVELEHAFDPAVADLYADDAVIKNKRRYPTGQVRELELVGSQYKALIRQAMPLAKARGDRSTYSNVTYNLNDDGSVDIKASRYSELKDYTSPLRLTVAPDDEGRWRIIVEISESQP
ncbi:MAG: hypothetical protein ACLF0P_05485 [Thermoanaerobaculia bacterium]